MRVRTKKEREISLSFFFFFAWHSSKLHHMTSFSLILVCWGQTMNLPIKSMAVVVLKPSCSALTLCLGVNSQSFWVLLPALFSWLRCVCAYPGSRNHSLEDCVLPVLRGALVLTYVLVHKVFAHFCSSGPFLPHHKVPPGSMSDLHNL